MSALSRRPAPAAAEASPEQAPMTSSGVGGPTSGTSGSGDPSSGAWGAAGPGGASVLEPLAREVRAGSVANANTEYGRLRSGGRTELRTHPILREYVALIGGAAGRAVLVAVAPAKELWADIANGVFAGSNADLTASLREMGLTDGRKLAANVALISPHANLRAFAVLSPLLTAAADARNHGAVLSNPSAVALVQGGGSTFAVLTGLDDAATRAAYEAVEAARLWLDGDLPGLGTKVVGWGAAAVRSWTELSLRLGLGARVETWYDAAPATWGPALSALFAGRPSDLVKTTYVAGQSLAVKVIDGVGAATPEDAARACQGLGWQPTSSFERGIAGNWLNAAAAARLAGRDLPMNEMLACTASVQTGLGARGIYPLDAFPAIARDDAAIARLYQTNAGFKAAIEADPGRYATLHARIPAIAPVVAPGPAAPLPVVDPSNPTPLDALRTAVAGGDRAAALTAWTALGRRDRAPLAADPVLLPLVQLIGGAEGEGILTTLRPARALWLSIGATVYAGSAEALGRILRANGITGSARLAAAAAELVGHPAYASGPLLTPLLADASVRGHGDCLASGHAVNLLVAAFPGQSAFQVLPGLDSAGTLRGYRANLPAQTWLEGQLAPWSAKIVAWRTAGAWVDALLMAGKPAMIQQLHGADAASWGPLLQGLFTRPSALVQASFLPTVAFAQSLIDAIGTANKAQGVACAKGLRWTPIQIVERAIAGAWLDAAVLSAVLPRDAAGQEAMATHAGLLGALPGLALHPTVAFPALARDAAKMAQLFRVHAPFQTAMLADLPTFQTWLGTQRNLGPWVEALLAAGRLQQLLELAAASPRPWLAGVNASPGGIDAILAAAPVGGAPSALAYRGLYAVFGPPAQRSLAQCLTFYERLAGGDLLPPGDRTVHLPAAPNTITDPATGNAWRIRRELIGMAPTLAAMASLINDLSVMPQSAVGTNVRLIFVNLVELQWAQTAGGAVSASFHNFASPQMRDIGTSMAGGGLNILRCDGRGGPIREIIGTDRDGAAEAYGGGSTNGAQRLSFFQNHARHEFGHNVGGTQFNRPAGGVLNGNADALTWGGWAADNAAGLKADYWNPVGPDNWNVPDGMGGTVAVAIPADDAFTYLQTALYTMNLPGAGNAVWDNTVSFRDAWQRISTSAAFKDTALVKYLKALGAPNLNNDSAFQFPGFTPPGATVHIYSTRWNGGQPARYDKGAFDALHRPVGWYSLSSPNEMFAEIYTKHYSGRATPGARNGVDWSSWFTDLDASPTVAASFGNGQTAGGAAGAAGVGEVEPPAALVRGVW